MNTVDEAPARARGAMAVPTTCLLGAGGFNGTAPAPGAFMSAQGLQQALDDMRLEKPAIHARCMAGLAPLGRTPASCA